MRPPSAPGCRRRPTSTRPAVDGSTALHWAVHRDALDVVDLLLGAGANPMAANRYGVTPLSLAATNGNARIVERLLRSRRAIPTRRCPAARRC